MMGEKEKILTYEDLKEKLKQIDESKRAIGEQLRRLCPPKVATSTEKCENDELADLDISAAGKSLSVRKPFIFFVSYQLFC